MSYAKQIARERQERIALLRGIAGQVARHLGWSLRETEEDKFNDCRAYLTDAKQREIGIELTNWPHQPRFEVYGLYPRDANRNYMLYHDDERPHITVAARRGAEALAREIERRFMPGYEKTYNLALTRIAQADRREQEIERDAQAIAEIMGDKPRRLNGAGSKPRIYASGSRAKYGFFEVSSPNYITLELSGLDTETARRLAMVLAD